MSFVKSAEHWLFFDDELVEPMTEQLVQTAFGSTQVTRPTCSYSLELLDRGRRHHLYSVARVCSAIAVYVACYQAERDEL